MSCDCVQPRPRDTVNTDQAERAQDRQTSGGSLDLGVEAGRVGGSHRVAGAGLTGQVAAHLLST